jgi:hypothetical protein
MLLRQIFPQYAYLKLGVSFLLSQSVLDIAYGGTEPGYDVVFEGVDALLSFSLRFQESPQGRFRFTQAGQRYRHFGEPLSSFVYITRPALANERVKIRQNGDVVLKLKSPYQNETAHVVMAPLEFLQKLAALVPRPRLNLIR